MNHNSEAILKKLCKKVLLVRNITSNSRNGIGQCAFQTGFAATRPQAKQLISHGAIEVNGGKQNLFHI